MSEEKPRRETLAEVRAEREELRAQNATLSQEVARLRAELGTALDYERREARGRLDAEQQALAFMQERDAISRRLAALVWERGSASGEEVGQDGGR